MRNNFHGPCGEFDPSAPCMSNDGSKTVNKQSNQRICSKGFPKEFNDRTIINENSFTEYRRRDTGKHKRGSHYIVNRWVDPYCPYPSKEYNCNINVEACTPINAVKYINKQGYDVCTVKVGTRGTTFDNDETVNYLAMRFVDPSEAYWRMLSFKLYYMAHSVKSFQFI